MLDPQTLVEQTFDAIEPADQAIFVSLSEARAKAEAAAASRRIREGRSLGLLDGVPIAWKDLFAVEGLATTAGSVVLKDASPRLMTPMSSRHLPQPG